MKRFVLQGFSSRRDNILTQLFVVLDVFVLVYVANIFDQLKVRFLDMKFDLVTAQIARSELTVHCYTILHYLHITNGIVVHMS